MVPHTRNPSAHLRTDTHRLIAHLIRRASRAAHAAIVSVELGIHAAAIAQAQPHIAGANPILAPNRGCAAIAAVAAHAAIVAVRKQVAAHAIAIREADLALAFTGDAELIHRAGVAAGAAVIAV